MSKADEVDYEARLLRQVMIRRLVMGVGAITLGLCLAVMTSVMTYMLFTRSSSGGRKSGRLIAAGFVMSVMLVGFGVVTLRRGEVDLDTGEIYETEPVPTKAIAIATTLVCVVISAIAAWPLGVYDWAGARFSKCHELVTAQELNGFAGAELTEGSIQDSDLVCSIRYEVEGEAVAVVAVRGDHWVGGYEFEEKRLRDKAPVEGLGDLAVQGDRSGFHYVGFMKQPSGAYVMLKDSLFDEADRHAVIELLKTRTDLVVPYER